MAGEDQDTALARDQISQSAGAAFAIIDLALQGFSECIRRRQRAGITIANRRRRDICHNKGTAILRATSSRGAGAETCLATRLNAERKSYLL